MPDPLHCTVLRSTAELEAFGDTWRALWRSDPTATPFQSPEWLLPWWRQFGQPELRAVVLSRAGKDTGLLPFYVLDEAPHSERQLLPVGVSTTDYLDGVFAPECSVDDIVAGLSLLVSEDGWDSMTVPQLRPESRLCQALTASGGFAARAGTRFDADACSRMPAVPIAELSAKLRGKVRYYLRRASNAGPLTLRVAEAQDCEEMLAALERLHAQRWQERGEEGVLQDPRVLAWHHEAAPRLLAAGMLRLCSLQLAGETIAVTYSLVDPPWRPHRTEYIYLTAFSTAHGDFRPGTVLLGMEGERAAHEGVRTIDMLRGEEAYKQTIWHMERVPTVGFRLQNPARAGLDDPSLAHDGLGAVA